MKIILDVSRLTFDDHIDFEDEAGCTVFDAIRAMADNTATMRQQKALVWIFTRAGRLRPTEIEFDLPGDDD